MSKVLFAWLLAAVLAIACQDRFRYPCQDPKNAHLSECHPPACEANGTCRKYLLKDENEN